MIKKIDKEKSKQIYKEYIIKDFPEEEIPPYNVFINILNEGLISGYVYIQDKEEKGYMFCRVLDKHVFIMIFAIKEQYRNNGLGKAFINEIKEYFKDNFALFVEAETEKEANNIEDIEIIKRRIKFYENLGFNKVEDIDYKCVGVSYYLMLCNLTNNEITDNIIDKMEKIYTGILRNIDMLKIERLR